MKKNSKLPNIITILILTAITSGFWIIFGVYRIFTVKPDYKVPDEILAPFSPVLDQKVIDQMSQRFYLEENQIPETVVVNSNPSPIPEPSTTPVPTETDNPIINE
jgi:hypothetical protein